VRRLYESRSDVRNWPKADADISCLLRLDKKTNINQNNVEFNLGWKVGKCQILYWANFYVGWDSMISTLLGNHSALAEEESRRLNATGAV